MKKKRVLWSVLFALCFTVFGLSARAEEGSYPQSEWTDAKYFEFDASTGTITGYSLDGPKDVVIPAEINGVAVRHIGKNAFYKYDYQLKNLYEIRSVQFPQGLISIGFRAFRENQLTQVHFPEGLISIGHWAFYDNQLTQVHFSEGLTSIGENAFCGNQLTQVHFSEGLTSIEYMAFHDNQLTQVHFPEGLISIGNSAFSWNQLTQVSFPDSLQKIEARAFILNELTEVVVPEACNVHPNAFEIGVKIYRRKGGAEPIPVPNEEDLFDKKVIADPKYSWTVTFNGALDPSTVNAKNFFIQDAEGNILTGIEPTLMDGGIKVRFENHTTFEKNKDYYLVVKKDVRGQGNTNLKKTVILKFRVE